MTILCKGTTWHNVCPLTAVASSVRCPHVLVVVLPSSGDRNDVVKFCLSSRYWSEAQTTYPSIPCIDLVVTYFDGLHGEPSGGLVSTAPLAHLLWELLPVLCIVYAFLLSVFFRSSLKAVSLSVFFPLLPIETIILLWSFLLASSSSSPLQILCISSVVFVYSLKFLLSTLRVAFLPSLLLTKAALSCKSAGSCASLVEVGEGELSLAPRADFHLEIIQ